MKKIAVGLCSVALILGGCSNPQTTDALGGSIGIDGSSTVYPVSEAVAEEFRVEEPNVRVTVGLSGSGGGFQKFCRGETDISNASRPIKDSEIELCNESGIEYLGLSVAYDGMAIIVNPENDWVDSITIAELAKMWEPEAQGTITKWNQIRPEWPDENLNLFGAGTASGTFDYFTEVIMGESGKSRGDYTASEDDNVLVQGVANDKFALGFFGLAYYSENADKLKLVAVDNGKGPVLPTLETVKNGEYEPLSRPLYIYVNNKSLQRPEVVSFVNFYLDSVGLLASDVGYIPMSDEEYATEIQKLQSFLKL